MELKNSLRSGIYLGLLICVLLTDFEKVEGGPKAIRFSSLYCESLNKSLVEFTKCKIHFIKRQSAISVTALLRDFVNDSAIIRVKIMQKQNGWRPFFYDKETNLCEFLANPKKHVIPYYFFELARKFHNIRHRCPYAPNETLAITDMQPKIDQFLSTMPLDIGEYGLFTYWYVKGKLVTYVNGSMTYTDYSKVI